MAHPSFTIAYITSSRLPTEKAYGYQIAKMCEQFAEILTGQGAIELWAPLRKSHTPESVAEFYRESYGIRKLPPVRRLGTFDWLRMQWLIGPLGFQLHVVDVFVGALLKLMSKSRRITVYSRDWWALLFTFFGIPVIHECHRISTRSGLFFILARRARRIIVVTEALKRRFMDKGFSEDKILVAPDAVDLAIFDPAVTKDEARERLGLPKETHIIGYMGRLKTMGMEKGLTTILDALQRLQDPPMLLSVGGAAEDREEYQEAASARHLKGKTLFIERVPQQTLALYQKACDILLMPFPNLEHYAYYMSPLKMFEYMASGRPIIASNLPSVREILNKENAVLVPSEDAPALAQAIKHLLNDPGEAERIAKQARADVQFYTWKRRAEIIADFIKS